MIVLAAFSVAFGVAMLRVALEQARHRREAEAMFKGALDAMRIQRQWAEGLENEIVRLRELMPNPRTGL